MIKRILFLILVVLCPFGLAWAADWPQWRGPDRTGVSKETGLLLSWPPGGPKLLWTFRDAGAGYSCMSIVGDQLYSMGGKKGDKEYVYALDLKTQKKLWSVEVGAFFRGPWPGPRSTPTIDGNFLYAIGSYGDLVCVEITTGKKIWSQGLKTNLGGWEPIFGYSESPLVDGDLVVATPGGQKGAIAAFDKKTGVLRWRSSTFADQACNASMIAIEVGGVRQYVQMTWNNVAGVRASDGKLLWSFPFIKGIPTPIYRDGCLYVSSTAGGCKLVQLKREGHTFKVKEIYANGEMKNYHGGLILVDDYLYGFSDKYESEGDGWTCQDFQTGKRAWIKEGGSSGSITFADGNLYCYYDTGDVLLIKATADGCKEQGKFRLPERCKKRPLKTYTHPVVINGKLYLRDQDLIFCYDVRKPQGFKRFNRQVSLPVGKILIRVFNRS